jgi:hypothetical protein
LVRDFNLFPETDKLLTLERKYGDSLSFEDINGKPGKSKKKKQGDESNQSQMQASEGTKLPTIFGSSVDPKTT